MALLEGFTLNTPTSSPTPQASSNKSSGLLSGFTLNTPTAPTSTNSNQSTPTPIVNDAVESLFSKIGDSIKTGVKDVFGNFTKAPINPAVLNTPLIPKSKSGVNPDAFQAPILTGPSDTDLKQKSDTITSLQKELTASSKNIDLSDQSSVDAHNEKVNQYNSLIDNYKQDIDKANLAIGAQKVLGKNIIPVGQTIKFPLVKTGVDVGNGPVESITKSLVEFPEKATRTLTELAGLSKANSDTRSNQYAVPSYAEVAGKTTAELIDQGIPASAAVILASASQAGAFANDALMYYDPLKGVLKSTTLEDALTKQVVEKTIPSTEKYFNTAQVRDIWQTNTLLSEAEKNDIITTIGGDQSKIKDALKNGISIGVPEQKIVTLEDKPYWSKIKGYFGVEPSSPKLISSTTRVPVQTVRGYLDSAGEQMTGDNIQKIAENIKAGKPAIESKTPTVKIPTTKLSEVGQQFKQKAPELIPQSKNITTTDAFKTLDMGNLEGTEENEKSKQLNKDRIAQETVPMGDNKTGETFHQFQDRILPEFQKILNTAKDGTTIVTHSSVLKLMKQWEAEGRPADFRVNPEKYNQLETKTGDVETFDGKNGEVHVVRHGQTQDNVESNFRSPTTKLTDQGVEQAHTAGQELAQKLDGKPIPEIISSSLPRAVHTSNILNEEAEKGPEEGRKQLPERPAEPERITKYKERLKLRGADPVLVDAIITPRGNRAFGMIQDGKITLEKFVEDFTEDHEIFHQVFQNMEKMRLFKNFDKAELIAEAKDLYGDLPEAQLEEEMAKDFQQYVNEQENGKSTSFFGKIAEFFQRLFASIKRLFKSPEDINEFYRTIHEETSREETVPTEESTPAFNEKKETQSIEQLQNQRERFQQSLDAFNENPQAHIQAYGEDKSQVYKDKISEINQRIKDIKNPKVDTARELMKAVENRTGVTPVEQKKLETKGKKYKFAIPEFNGATPTDMILRVDPLKGHPATPFLKYVNPRTGELPPIHEETPGVYGKEMTTLLDKKDMSFEDAQAEVTNYIENANLIEQLYEDNFNPIELNPETVVTTPIFETEVARLKDKNAKPLETMIDQSDSIPLKNKVGLIDYIRTPNRVFKKMGLDDEMKLLKKKNLDYLKELPKNIQRITDYAKSLPKTIDGKPVAQRIFDYLNGGNVDENGFIKPDYLTADEKKVGDSIKAWLTEWADRLKIPKHERIENYITHIFEDDLIKKEFDEDLAKIIQGKVAGQVYDPFLEKRLGALGYKRDVWAALEAYVKRATRKVHMDVALEQMKIAAKTLDIASYNYVNEYIDRVNLRPTKTDVLLDNSLKQMFGYRFGQRPTARLSKLGRQMVSRGTLGLNISSALKNLTQGVNTYAKLGEKYTIIGYTKLLNRLNHQELYDEGILGNDLATQDKALSATKKFWENTDKALFYLFETVEHINRGSAYFGAKAKYYAENSRTENGIQIWKEDTSEEKAREYARTLVEDTQFTFGAVDTPPVLSSDIAKTLLQFQSFNIKQLEFLTEMAKNKNYAGLIRFVLATLAFGYTIGKLFGFKWQDMIPGSRYSLPPIPNAVWTTFQALADAPDQFGNQRTAKQKGLDILNTATPFIPGYVQGNKTFQGVQSIKQGEAPSITDKATALAFGPKTLITSPVSKQLNQNVKTAQTKLDTFDSGMVKEMQAKYDEAKSLGFDSDAAQKIVDDLSDDQYTVYKAVAAVGNAQDAVALESKILPIAVKASLLGLGSDAADKYIEEQFPDTAEGDKEYKVYTSVLNTLKGTITDNAPGKWNNQSFTTHMANWAKAFGTDPVTLFKDIFAGNQSWKIMGTENGQIMVARADEAVTDAIRKQRGATKDMILDHTISIEAGGNNSNDNLLLIPKGDEDTPGTWAWNTPTEDLIGGALKKGLITGAQAREYNIRFKMTAGEALSAPLQKEFKDKYKSEPLTPDQIKGLIEK